ncbi:uncharacterized protein MKZ38_003171 [Zalerion maritima]|uniref:Sister chromatid cohesion protein DCC1 n=1 Tax=Zalerion maritima TaxID=339359 RepID=A0AAD5RYX1_9PEZI|nr:uncharacterized protein MKZ38_003171 [Zalerion maritima]
MSQLNGGTPLTHAPDGQSYRLLELPPDLLQLLESDDPPVLALESSPGSAIIKTPDGKQKYSMRQKNTSNALILLQPVQVDPSSSETEIRTIATVHETVELLLESSTEAPKVVAQGKWHEKFGKGR